MVEILLEDEKLILQRRGREKGATEQIRLPLEHVAGACVDSFPARNWLQKQRFLAAYVPRAAQPGTQYEDGDCIFWEIRDPLRTIVIYLEDEPYGKLVVEVAEPLAAARFIQTAITERCS